MNNMSAILLVEIGCCNRLHRVSSGPVQEVHRIPTQLASSYGNYYDGNNHDTINACNEELAIDALDVLCCKLALQSADWVHAGHFAA